MKKFIAFALVFVLVFSVAATAVFAEEKKTLVFGTSADYAPFEFMYPDETGKMVYGGIDVMVAQYIADYLGMELQIENMDFGYLLTALNKGDFDMVLADIEPTEKRLKAADFSDPYYSELPEFILIRAEDADKYKDAGTDFNGVSVGAQTGSTKIEKAEENLVGCVVVSLPLVTDLVNELVNKKIDAILLDGSVALSYASQYAELAIAEEASTVFPEPNGIAVAVAKGDPKGLLPGINDAVAKLVEENKPEEFKAIVDQIQGIEEVSADAPEGYEADE
ncbi:MAG: transporter substrate-binding domain-containing protein [Oscillospiraceae bacterium]|nr:transporter substrate-binding domain-containing protein [Oscillospiraceae bacterium]